MRILIFNVLIFLSGIVSACTTFSLTGENSFRENSYDANYNLQEYSVINDIKIPVKLEVSWLLDSGLWTWLKLEVREVRYNVTGEA